MPKLVDKESRRREMAAGLIELFARKGYENSSIREITDVLGMGKGTFYDYFEDKEDLLNEMSRVVFATWDEFFKGKIAQISSPIEQLKTIIYEGAASAAMFEKYLMIYIDIWRLSVSGPAFADFHRSFRRYLAAMRGVVAGIIDKCKNEGTIRDSVDSGALSTTIIAFLDGLCFHYLILKPSLDLSEAASSFYSTLLDGVSLK